MSYHSPWKWTDDQFNGFKSVLSDVDVEYQVVQMDTKRNSDETWKHKITNDTVNLIDTWEPDLVFLGDDNAQRYITTQYINSDTPFVFCAVNAEPEEYGFNTASNVTGVLERMHFVQSVRLLKSLVPTVRSIALISDKGNMWGAMVERFKQKVDQLEDVQVVSYDFIDTFAQFQQTILKYQDTVDAIGFLGVFEYKDDQGVNVPLETVTDWVNENSHLPDFSFWKDRVDKGTLCAVTVSGLAQGQAAGNMARRILLDGRRPSDITMETTETGLPVINLARARKLKINPQSSVFLTAEVVKEIH